MGVDQLFVLCFVMCELVSLIPHVCSIFIGVCNHAFHFHCISRWLKTRQVCPLGMFSSPFLSCPTPVWLFFYLFLFSHCIKVFHPLICCLYCLTQITVNGSFRSMVTRSFMWLCRWLLFSIPVMSRMIVIPCGLSL